MSLTLRVPDSSNGDVVAGWFVPACVFYLSTVLESVASSKRNQILKCHSQLSGLRVMEREPTIEAETAP
jgi:hypothetical protein